MTLSLKLIKTMTKLEKETRQRLYVFIKNTQRNSRQQRAHTLTRMRVLSTVLLH